MGFWNKQHDPMEDFQTKNWEHLSEDERTSRLQYLEDAMAKEQGRAPREVTTYQGRGCGYYDNDNPGKLFVNQNYIDTKMPCDQYDAMNTVIHEGRHAYQYDCIEGKIRHSERKETVSMWEKNAEIYHKPSDNFSSYRFQPMEADANNFADAKMESFDQKFGKDSNYRDYIDSIIDEKQKNIATAQRHYGPDYQQVIEDNISRDYDWNHRYVPTEEERNAAFNQLCDYADQKYGDYWQNHIQEYIVKDPEFRNMYQTAFPDQKLPPMEAASASANIQSPTMQAVGNSKTTQSNVQFSPEKSIVRPRSGVPGKIPGGSIFIKQPCFFPWW